MGCIMLKTTSPTYLPKEYNFSILEHLSVQVTIINNPYQVPMDALFSMAARINKKRGFLFVSKVLGKHLPIQPGIGLLGGAILAGQLLQDVYGIRQANLLDLLTGLQSPDSSRDVYVAFSQERFPLPEKVTFIGFAETATALGHSMFAAFTDKASYIHTTREQIQNLSPVLTFEEEHSHATSHRFYTLDPAFLDHHQPIVLVDDEITTGKTALNIIAELHQAFPRKTYVVASLLDWRSDADEQRFAMVEQELGITIKTISLLRGKLQFNNNELVSENRDSQPENKNERIIEDRQDCGPDTELREVIVQTIYLDTEPWAVVEGISTNALLEQNDTPYLAETGRFGLTSERNQHINTIAQGAATKLITYRISTGKPTLCLGTGEFMYLPMLIASYMGENVLYHSTTRSPIHPHVETGYGAQNKFVFANHEDPQVTNYLYNIPFNTYQDVFLFIERDVPMSRLQPTVDALLQTGIEQLYLVVCSSKNGKQEERQ